MSEPRPPLPSAWRRPRGWLLAIGIGLVLAFAAIAWVQMRQVSLLGGALRNEGDNLVWRFFELESEFLQLRDQLREAQLEPGDPVREVTAARVRQRFMVFARHLPLVQPAQVSRLLNFGPDHASTIAALDAFVARHAPVLAEPAARPLTRQAALAGLADMSGLFAPVHTLTLNANQLIAEQVGQRNDAVRDQTRLSIGLTMFLSVLTLAFALVTLRQFRSLVRRRHELQQVADKLRDARAEAEASSLAKSAFLANMSHELRTPFNGMLGMLTLLDSDKLDAEQNDYLRTARQSAHHLLDLLNDILDISKLESGRLDIVAHPVDLQRLLRDVRALMALSAESKGLALRVHVAPELPGWVMADGKRLKQILFNLMSNALKFTDEGEVSLTVSTRPAPADALGAEPMHELRFVVRDSGIGMHERMRARLFQRFSQGDDSTSRRFGGTGLGLEISRSLARKMGGDLTADSKPGLGSVFTLSLDLPGAQPDTSGSRNHDGSHANPAATSPTSPTSPTTSVNTGTSSGATTADPGSAALAALAGAPADNGNGLDLVVADDHPVNRKFMATLLRRMGHRVRLASNGAEAVALVADQVPDLVFMDLHMPVQDGLQATRTLRAGPAAMARVPIVALSADAFADTRARVLGAGMNNFLSKPVQADDIEAMLIAMFGARALARRRDGADTGDCAAPSRAADAPPLDKARPPMTATLTPPSTTIAQAAPATPTPTPASTPAPRRRFRTSDVAAHLDMGVIGDVCVGITLAGYQSVLVGFLDDDAGSSANLLAALVRGDNQALKSLAHAVKGASASMGLRAIHALALQLEADGADYSSADCSAAAEQLRDLLATAKALLQRMGFVPLSP